MINVTKSIIKKDEKYLLIKRSTSSKFFPEMWDFPGGKIELEENPVDSAIRETKEETSLNIEIGKEILEGNHNEKGIIIHYIIFSILNYKGKVKLSKDHSEFGWFSKEQIKNCKKTPFVDKYFKNSD